MQPYSSLRPESPLQIVSAFEDADVAWQALSLLSTSSILWVLGCDLAGKLIDRALYLEEEEDFGENAAIVGLFMVEKRFKLGGFECNEFLS